MGAYENWLAKNGKTPQTKVNIKGGSYAVWLANREAKKLAEQDRLEREQAQRELEEKTRKAQSKLGLWGRLSAGLDAFSTGNAANTAAEKGLLKGIGQYGKDIYEGFSDAITGTDENLSQKNKKTYKDLAVKMGMKDRKGKLDWADVIGFVGDVGLDPTTYIGAGAVKGGKEVVGGGVKVVASRDGLKFIEKTVAEAGKKGISKKAAYDAAIKVISESPKLQAKTGVRFAGQTILNQKTLDKLGMHTVGTRGLTVGAKDAVLGLAEKAPIAGKYVKGTRDVIKKTFDPIVSRGLDKVADGELAYGLINKAQSKIRGEQLAAAKQTDKALKEILEKNLDPAKMADAIEKTGGRFKIGRNKAGETRLLDTVTGELVEPKNLKDYVKTVRTKSGSKFLYDLGGKRLNYQDFVDAATKNSDAVAEDILGARQADAFAKEYDKWYDSFIRTGVKPENAQMWANEKAYKAVEGVQHPREFIDAVIADIKKAKTPAEKKLVYDSFLKNRFGNIAASADTEIAKALNPDQMAKVLGRKTTAAEDAAMKAYIQATQEGSDEAVGLAAQAYADATRKLDITITDQKALGKTQELLQTLGAKDYARSGLVKTGNQAFDDAANAAIKAFDNMFQEEMKRGLQMNKTRNYVPHVLSPEFLNKVNQGDQEALDLMQRLSTSMRSQNRREWVDTIENINKVNIEKYGIPLFDDNLYRAVAERTKDHIRSTNISDLANELAEGWGINAEKQMVDMKKPIGLRTSVERVTSRNVDGVDYRQVMTKAKDGNLVPMAEFEGTLLPNDLADAVEKVFNFTNDKLEQNAFIKLYDNLLDKFKTSVTIFFPSFHTRNFYSGLFNNWLAGVNDPTVYGINEAVILGKKGALTITEGADAGKTITYKKILDEAKKLDIYGQTGASDINKVHDNIAQQVGDTITKTGGKVHPYESAKKVGSKVTQTVEDALRGSLFINELKKGNSFEGAAEVVKKFHFDYSESALTHAENSIFRRIVPFYVWTRKNVPLQLEQLGRQPGKYTVTNKVLMGGDRKGWFEDRENASDDVKNRSQIRIGGKMYNIDLPMSDIIRPLDRKQTAGMVSPLIKFPIEKLTNYNWFYGSQIRDNSLPREEQVTSVKDLNPLAALPFANKVFGNENLPKFVKDYLNLTQRDNGTWQMDSGKAHTINSFLGRLMTTTGKLADDSEQAKSYAAKSLEFWTGISEDEMKKKSAGNFKREIIKQFSKEEQTEYNDLHIFRKGETPLLYSTRRATTYIDFPEFFFLDKEYNRMQKEQTGKDYDPIYDLPWDQAKKIYAQTAKGDRWNSKELEKTEWYTKFQNKRSEYYKKTGEKYKDGAGTESEEFYKEPTTYVKNQMEAENWSDPAVKKYLEESRQLKNNKRTTIGLVTPDRYNEEKQNIFDGKNDYKAAGGKSLAYMQAIRMAGFDTYDKFFAENPEIDPLKGGKMSGSYTRKPRKVKYKSLKTVAQTGPKPRTTKKVSKVKLQALAKSKAKLKADLSKKGTNGIQSNKVRSLLKGSRLH